MQNPVNYHAVACANLWKKNPPTNEICLDNHPATMVIYRPWARTPPYLNPSLRGQTPMFDMPKSILRKLLTVYHTQPAQLTESESSIAGRIVVCSLCDNLWLRRRKKLPDRCPKCHRRAWNRPLLEAMLAATPTTRKTESQEEKT